MPYLDAGRAILARKRNWGDDFMLINWLRNENKGQSMVETALVLPIIVLILMGIIDFGFLFNNYLIIDNASREGARTAVIGSTDSVITTTVSNMTSSLVSAKLKTTINPSGASRTKGSQVTVTVEYDYSLITPVIGAIVPNPVHLKAITVMRVE